MAEAMVLEHSRRKDQICSFLPLEQLWGTSQIYPFGCPTWSAWGHRGACPNRLSDLAHGVATNPFLQMASSHDLWVEWRSLSPYLPFRRWYNAKCIQLYYSRREMLAWLLSNAKDLWSHQTQTEVMTIFSFLLSTQGWWYCSCVGGNFLFQN